jgi:hypothetical protein
VDLMRQLSNPRTRWTVDAETRSLDSARLWMKDAARNQGLVERFAWTTSSEAREATARLTARGRDEA